MGNSLPPRDCRHDWCSEPGIHTRHEGVIETWPGADPNLPDMPRTMQLVMYATEPLGSVLPIEPQLALTITGPDLRTPDRVSVTLAGRNWRRVRDRLGAYDDERRRM